MDLLAASLTAVLLVAACAGCAGTEDGEEAVAAYRNLDPDVAYVGREACRSCHPDKYETFVEAQMGRSIKPAHPDESAARFDGVEPVYDEVLDLYYRPERWGDDLFVVEYRLADGDTTHKRTEQIDFIVGSGQHTNSHIMSVNGYLYQMPLTWYAQDGKWDLPPGFDGGNNSRFDRPIPEACMTCHNAMPGFVDGSENQFSHVPAGIDCERCHGPGALHVEEKEAGMIVDTSVHVDRSIVNPARLPLDRQFDVCQRCHMQGATVYAPGMGPGDFRPGMDLSNVLNVFWPRYADSTQQFIMASHPDRMRMSACFTGSHEEGASFEPMTCTTCHDPHVPIEALGSDHYRDVCQSCHEPEELHADGVDAMAAGACTEEIVLREEVGDDCVQCHMPVSGSTDIPHVRVTDHFIRVVDTTGSVNDADVDAAKRLIGLASLIDDAPTPRERAEGFMTYFEEVQNRLDFLDSAAVLVDRAVEEQGPTAVAPSLVRLHHLQRDFDATVRLSREIAMAEIDEPWTHYRVGEAYQTVGNVQEAIVYFEEAVRRSPAHLRFLNKLGSAYTEARRLDEALEVFDRVLNANPKYAEARNNRGFVHILQQDFEAAEADFLEAIRLDPDAEIAFANLASLYFNTNRREEASPYARRLVEEHPDDPNYQRL
ncbi:MAG: tetratricopeptide repeat protein, partial [Rhodothermales bacterium]